MVFLIFGHTAEEPPLRIGPLPSFRVAGALIQDHAGATVARHNGERWLVGGKPYYRMDCEGPVTVQLEGCSGGESPLGPFMHFSLLNETAFASRDLFAHYREQDDSWHLHRTDASCSALVVTPQQVI